MLEHYRLFEVGPDPFGRKWKVEFKWQQTAISIRHADTVDVKFLLTSDDDSPEEKVVALPHALLLDLARERKRGITDPWCMKMAALHVQHMIETTEDMDQTLVTLSAEELAGYDRALQGPTAAG